MSWENIDLQHIIRRKTEWHCSIMILSLSILGFFPPLWEPILKCEKMGKKRVMGMFELNL